MIDLRAKWQRRTLTQREVSDNFFFAAAVKVASASLLMNHLLRAQSNHCVVDFVKGSDDDDDAAHGLPAFCRLYRTPLFMRVQLHKKVALSMGNSEVKCVL